MARRIFASLMLLVLMWTGAFLHDLAEGHEHDMVAAAQAEPAAESSEAPQACALDDTLPPLMSEAAYPDHVHLIGVVSKHYVHSAQAQISRLVFPPPWTSRSDLMASAKSERGPPGFASEISTDSNNRLYLANRRLLI